MPHLQEKKKLKTFICRITFLIIFFEKRNQFKNKNTVQRNNKENTKQFIKRAKIRTTNGNKFSLT